MPARSCRQKRSRIATRRRLNSARPTEGRVVVPSDPTPSALVRLLIVQALERGEYVGETRSVVSV